MCEQVWTIDEDTQQVLRWPSEKTYLRELVQIIQEHQHIAVPKSRRMLVSWLLSAWATWRARYLPHNWILIQSENEDKAAYLTDRRCAFIEDHLEDAMLRRKYDAWRTKKGAIGKITYRETGSTILAVPQGGSVVRAHTFSALIMDEADFQDEGGSALTAALSIAEKVAKIILMTSSNGPTGVVAELCREVGMVVYRDDPMPMKPVRTMQSPRRFAIAPVHYSHDTTKDETWKQRERQKYQRDEDWDREMEMDFRAVAGVRAYPRYFADLHLDDRLVLIPFLPVCLALDFNVEPMVWEIAQVIKGSVYFVDEIRMAPADIPSVVNEFRNRYPAHKAEIWVYGDATGHSRTSQTAQSDYDLVRLAFRGYPSPLVMKVPPSNPPVKDRLASVNYKLRSADGLVGIKINPVKCPELVKDMVEVVLRPDGRDVHQTWNRTDPYHERTHASSAAGYLIHREFPTLSEVYRHHERPRQPRKYGQLLGKI